MCHLLRGFSCETLGVAPFLPVDLSWMEGSAADFLGMKELDTKVVILPGISAFVGADIMAGIAKEYAQIRRISFAAGYRNEWGDGAWKLPSYVCDVHVCRTGV